MFPPLRQRAPPQRPPLFATAFVFLIGGGGVVSRRHFVDLHLRLHTFCRMTLAQFPELRKLPTRVRLKIAEQLWDSAAGDNLPVPATHKTLIRSRREAYRRGEIVTMTMAELKKSIRRRS